MQKKDTCADYVASVIHSVLKDRKVLPVPESLTLSGVYEYAKRHSVETIVWYGLSRLDAFEEEWESWSKRVDQLLAQSIAQLSEKDRIYKAFIKHHIEILPVKGCWMKEMYPQIDYRQMSDLDILIHKKDQEKVRTVLEQLGYTNEKYDIGYEDTYLLEPYVSVEMHTLLLGKGCRNAFYYEDIWERVIPVEGMDGIYRMTPEDMYLYFLVHMERHYEDGGCGIRFLMDRCVLVEHYPDLDWGYINRQLQILHLNEFEADVKALSEYWFGDNGREEDVNPEFYERVARAGIYGTKELYAERKLDRIKEKVHNPAMIKFCYLWKRTFVPVREMEYLYPVLKKVPVLLPVCWVLRLLAACRKKPQTVKQEFDILKKNS